MVQIELSKKECKALLQILRSTTKALEEALDLPDEHWTDVERKAMNDEWFLIENITHGISEHL